LTTSIEEICHRNVY